jgi:SAM-dependent methyltransferase
MPVDVSALTSDSIGHDFNTIVCFNVLEHIADDREALVAMRATLLPDGYLLLLVPAHPALYGGIDRTVAHVRRYSRRPLADLLRESGFAVEVMRHVNPIGAAGWLVAGRLLGRTQVPQGPLMLYDRLVPLLRQFDLVDLHVGLSLWVVARRLA